MKINYEHAKIILNVRRGHESKEKLPKSDDINYLTMNHVNNMLSLNGSKSIFNEWVDSYLNWLEFQKLNSIAVELQLPKHWEKRIKDAAKLTLRDMPKKHLS